MRKPLTITHVLNNMCPRAGESIILRTMCPHSNIEMMLSPRREHHLQLTKITTIGNCVLVCTRTLILKHMLSWRREHHSRGRLFSTCWSSWGACNSAIESHRENQSDTSVKTTGIAKTIEKTKTTRKPRFQDHWVAKTIEKTKQKQEHQDSTING